MLRILLHWCQDAGDSGSIWENRVGVRGGIGNFLYSLHPCALNILILWSHPTDFDLIGLSVKGALGFLKAPCSQDYNNHCSKLWSETFLLSCIGHCELFKAGIHTFESRKGLLACQKYSQSHTSQLTYFWYVLVEKISSVQSYYIMLLNNVEQHYIKLLNNVDLNFKNSSGYINIGEKQYHCP